MEWKVGYKVVHPFNYDWGVGSVSNIGPLGRQITVEFPGLEEPVTLSTHNAAFQRWAFPLGSRAVFRPEGGSPEEVTLLQKVRDEDGYDLYTTATGSIIDERLLAPPEQVAGPLERLERLDVDPVDQYECRFAGMQLEMERQAGGLGAMLGARVTLFPHQLHVTTRVISRQPVRALLADEVGLGKTIEAGLIYSALRQAGRADRVLILTPDSLAVQWLGEMFRKFHDVFSLMDEERLADATTDHPDQNPWEIYPRAVCSLPYLADNEMLAFSGSELEGGWDLLIVDEAHHLRFDGVEGNPAYDAVASIAASARSILFLTATPMELDRVEYFGLLRLLQPTLFHDFDLFEVQLEEIAQANELAGALEAALGENPFDDEPEAGRQRAQEVDWTSVLPADLPQRIADTFPEQVDLEVLAEQALEGDRAAIRRLLSGLTQIHPLGDTVFSNTRARVGGFPRRRAEIRYLPWPEERRKLYEDVRDWVLGLTEPEMDPRSPESRLLFDTLRQAAGPLAGLKHELTFRRRLTRKEALAARLDAFIARCDALLFEESPRLDALLQEVRRALQRREKLLVFVHHLHDLLHLRERIEARVGVRVAVFHEGLSAADRDIQVAMFRSPDGYPVLLSTEAGGEGRNFQFCHRLVHFDLPPSPNRVEQRIGRLDRIGQTQEVESVVLVMEGTAEARIASLLEHQIGVFEHTIGGLDPIMEEIADMVVELSLNPGSLNPEAWQVLVEEAEEMLHGARDAITRGLDHLLHRGGFDRDAALELQARIPADLEARSEEFLLEFCELTGVTVQEKEDQGAYYLALDRYFTLDSLPGVSLGTAFLGTFKRDRALVREDIDYFATGHPLVEGIFGHLSDGQLGTASLRRFKRTGLRRSAGLQFNYRLLSGTRKLVDAGFYFPPELVSLAVDLDGSLRPDLIPLLTARYSKAYPMELEDVEHLTLQPGWSHRAAQTTLREVTAIWKARVATALERFDAFFAEESQRIESYFEHRLDSARAQAALGKRPALVKAAQAELRSLQREWELRIEELKERRAQLQLGQPVLDSVCLYVIE